MQDSEEQFDLVKEIDPYEINEISSNWAPGWLPLMRADRVFYFVPCYKEDIQGTPLYYKDLEHPLPRIAYDSLSTFFQTMIAAYTASVFTPTESGFVETDEERFARI